MPPDSEVFEPETLIAGRYQIQALLARGSDVKTYEVYDLELELACILKVLHFSKLSKWKSLELFQREAQTLAHLQHPQIPALLAYFEEPDVGFLVLEKVPGINLSQWLSRQYRFSEWQAYLLACQVLGVLDYLHRFNPPVIHRDIKPTNLIIDEQEKVSLIDFGGVQEVMGSGGSTMIGTYGYMAPEQFAGRALPQSDFYGLGATLIYTLSGREPADLPQHDLLLHFRPFVECSERFANWIEQMILPIPEQRFKDAAEALEVLRLCLPQFDQRLQLPGMEKTELKPALDWSLAESVQQRAGAGEAFQERQQAKALQPGSQLRGYQIQAVLGQGDASVVYAAESLSSQSQVIIRELYFERLEHWKSYELFERELKILGRLQHPAIPSLIEHFEIKEGTQHRFYLVSERLCGENLLSRLQQRWRPTEEQVRQIACQLLKILEFLQQQDPPLIHRDIKPSNVLIDEAGRISLVDFGAVQEAFRLRGGGGSTVIGTYGYMAPEQFVGKAGQATDLYGVGATLLHLLAGCSPAEIPQRELRLQFADYVHCSRQLFIWLEKMLAPQPEQRFGSVSEALDMLLKLDNLPGLALDPARQQQLQTSGVFEINESTEGLKIKLKPMYYDYKKLLPLLVGLNILGIPSLFFLPVLGPALFLTPPVLSVLLSNYVKQEGRCYELQIELDQSMFRYAYVCTKDHGSEVIETLEYPTASIRRLFLDNREMAYCLGIQVAYELEKRPILRKTTYPLASRRDEAEYVLNYLQDALAYYQRRSRA